MKTNNKQQTIPMSVFAEAAIIHFNCQTDDIEIRMIDENKEAFVIYDGNGYKISTREILREDIEFQLTDKDAVHHIDFWCWIEVTRNTVKMNRILGPLVRTIRDVEQAKKLLIAVGLGSYTDDTEVAFWEILARIDKEGELLGNAIVTVAKVYDGTGLIDDLTDLQIMYGHRVYNIFESGVFETVYLGDDKNEYPEFYIYSAEHYVAD